MSVYRVLVVDDNQSFCQQVVASFAEPASKASGEVVIEALGCQSGQQALPLIARLMPNVVVVDLVRLGSEGRFLIERLLSERSHTRHAPMVLALVPVVGDFSDLPDGVEVLVKPIFPSQVVSSVRRLLGPAPTLSALDLPRQPTELLPRLTPSAVEHVLPSSGARPPLDRFEEDSDFGPADTLLAPAASIHELARSMALVPDLLSQPVKVAPPASPAERGWSAYPDEDSEHGGGDTTTPLIELDLRGDLSGRIDSSGRPASGRPRPPRSGGVPQPAVESEHLALSGNVALCPLIDVLGMVVRQRQTGLLQVQTSGRRIELVLTGGRLAQATAQGFSALRLGRFIVEQGTLRQPELDAVVAARSSAVTTPATAREPKDLLGQRLSHAGLISKDELRHAIARQSTEILYEGLRLSVGRFTLEATTELPPVALDPELGGALSLDLEALLLEGYRRIHDWHQLDADVAESAVYVCTQGSQERLAQLGLAPIEHTVLTLCNGRFTIGEIAKESRLSLLDLGRTIGRLQSLGLLRRRLPAVLAS